MTALPPPPPSTRRPPTGWITAVVGLGIVAVAGIIAVIVLVTGSDGDDAPVAVASTAGTVAESGSSGTTTEPGEAAGSTNATPEGTSPDPGSTVPDGTSSSEATGGSDDAPATGSDAAEPEATEPSPPEPETTEPEAAVTTEPFVWDPGLVLEEGAGYVIDPSWTPHERIATFTYIVGWEGPGGSGGDLGTTPGWDGVALSWVVPCEAMVTFELIAWDADDVQLARVQATHRMAPCPPPVVPPSNLRSNEPNTVVGTVFTWDGGSGYDRYAYEVSVTRPGAAVAETDTGTFPYGVIIFPVDVWTCGASIDFTLIPLMADGTEVTRMSTTRNTSPCPDTVVVAGEALVVPAGRGNGRPAECPPGYAVVGGGYTAAADSMAGPTPARVYLNHASDNRWEVLLLAPADRAVRVQAYAVCMRGVSVVTTGNTMVIPPGRLRSVVAECLPDTFVSGGGWWTDPAPDVIVSTRDGNGWRVTAMNPTDADLTVYVRVRCIEDRPHEFEDVQFTFSVPDGAARATTLRCPAGTFMTAGGFAAPDALLEYTYTTDAVDWRFRAYNRNLPEAGPAAVVAASVVCSRMG